jgi:small subunit ribosomal protein S4
MMEKRETRTDSQNVKTTREKVEVKRSPKKTEYGKQLAEKQKVKEIYGLREAQFKRFFKLALASEESTGEMLLSLLERRLDNVLYRSKLASTRKQARQIIVHGHVLVNGKKVYSPSLLVFVDDEISMAPKVESKPVFLEQVIDKRLNSNVKVPDWIELDRKNRKGKILRNPVRADVQMPIEEHLIVELYSK